MLQRIAWMSVPSPTFSAARLNEIIAPSRRNNERNHVSGMLLFTGAQFLGLLEGDEHDLLNLWARLQHDSRHEALVRIGEERCGERWFPTWLMAHGDDAIVGRQLQRLRPPAARVPAWSTTLRPLLMMADSM